LYGGSLNAPVYNVYEAHDAMEATKILRDNVYMSPALLNLTNTLRSKKRCTPTGHRRNGQHCRQGGGRETQPKFKNDETMLPETEVVFRAVSPHGHVYWEIDPRIGGGSDSAVPSSVSDEDERAGAKVHTSSSDMSGSRQSSSRYSDSHPLIDGSSTANSTPQHRGSVLVNPFADVQLAGASETSVAPSSTTGSARFSSLRLGKPSAQQHLRAQLASHFGIRGQAAAAGGSTSSTPASRNPTPSGGATGELQTQVQIRDLRSIPGNVKSSDYILARIQSHIQGGGAASADVVATTAALDSAGQAGSPRQRRV
jgi:hypothetical protein